MDWEQKPVLVWETPGCFTRTDGQCQRCRQDGYLCDGMVLYELLVEDCLGERTQLSKILIKKEQGDLIPLDSIVTDVPENVLRVVGDCLERDETKRPRDLTVVLERLKIPIVYQKMNSIVERPTTVEEYIQKKNYKGIKESTIDEKKGTSVL